MRIVVWPSVISQPAAPRCVRRTRAPGLRARVMLRARGEMAIASAAAPGISGAAGDLPRLDQLDPHVVGRLHERDARAVRILDRPLEQAGAEPLEPLDVGFEVRRVEAEMLEAVVRARVARAQALVGARAGDVDVHAAVLALAADEAIAEHPRLVARDLEVERSHVPVGRLARIGRLEMDVVDPECHDRCPPSLTAISCSRLPRARAASGCAFSLWNVVQDLCIYTRNRGCDDGSTGWADDPHHGRGARDRRG